MLIKLKEYERIFQITSAIVDSEGGDPSHSCVYYSLFGANILIEHIQVEAKIRCGLAIFHMGEDGQALCFGESSNDGISATQIGFHCGVEANRWVLGFMAPTFGDPLKTEFTSIPKMFQQKAVKMSSHPNEMTKAGDFYLSHKQELADTILPPIYQRLGVQGLSSLCSQWFKKPPMKIPMSINAIDQNGRVRPVNLKNISLRSNW